MTPIPRPRPRPCPSRACAHTPTEAPRSPPFRTGRARTRTHTSTSTYLPTQPPAPPRAPANDCDARAGAEAGALRPRPRPTPCMVSPTPSDALHTPLHAARALWLAYLRAHRTSGARARGLSIRHARHWVHGATVDRVASYGMALEWSGVPRTASRRAGRQWARRGWASTTARTESDRPLPAAGLANRA